MEHMGYPHDCRYPPLIVAGIGALPKPRRSSHSTSTPRARVLKPRSRAAVSRGRRHMARGAKNLWCNPRIGGKASSKRSRFRPDSTVRSFWGDCCGKATKESTSSKNHSRFGLSNWCQLGCFKAHSAAECHLTQFHERLENAASILFPGKFVAGSPSAHKAIAGCTFLGSQLLLAVGSCVHIVSTMVMSPSKLTCNMCS